MWPMETPGADGYEVGEPATPQQIDEAEEQLVTRLRRALRDLYLTCDGILDQPGQWWVIWLLDRLVEVLRRHGMTLCCRDPCWRSGTMGRAIPSA